MYSNVKRNKVRLLLLYVWEIDEVYQACSGQWRGGRKLQRRHASSVCHGRTPTGTPLCAVAERAACQAWLGTAPGGKKRLPFSALHLLNNVLLRRRLHVSKASPGGEVAADGSTSCQPRTTRVPYMSAVAGLPL